MVSLGFANALIDDIIDDPTSLHPLLSSSDTNTSSSLTSIDAMTAAQILSGYTHGVRSVFVLNAALAALCVFVAYVMIHHKELIRADEAEMRRSAKSQPEAKQMVKTKGQPVEPGENFVEK